MVNFPDVTPSQAGAHLYREWMYGQETESTISLQIAAKSVPKAKW